MKKIFSLAVAGLMVLTVFTISCKRDVMKGLEYSDISKFDWLQANVKNKKGEGVLWFQVFDQVEDKATLNGYKNVKDKVDKYPAKIYEDKWIWMLINNRIEIRLIADDKSKDFQSTSQLKKFILYFDIAGLEAITGKKLKGKDFVKYIPKLGEKEIPEKETTEKK
ncbi:MAG: hypothetical protein JW807_11565 [Spirochaetes bacterium]|nr:hypothetical protein [Spirochaetota bacterium]